jgi:hypothetical protein
MQKFGSDEEEEYRNVVHVLRELAENYPSPIRGTLTSERSSVDLYVATR